MLNEPGPLTARARLAAHFAFAFEHDHLKVSAGTAGDIGGCPGSCEPGNPAANHHEPWH
jgi:hypothetical protein